MQDFDLNGVNGHKKMFPRVGVYVKISNKNNSVLMPYNKDGLSDKLFGIFIIIFTFNPNFLLSLNGELWTVINIISGFYLVYYIKSIKRFN